MEKGPGPNDTEVFANVAQALLPKVARWTGAKMLPSAESADLVQELMRMLEDASITYRATGGRLAGDYDAYRLARFLDGAGWEVDERLVEILREVPWLINKYRGLHGSAA
jgi:hypothetical protein